jgi:DNA repair exonuclease SbcCD nuclease subunit
MPRQFAAFAKVFTGHIHKKQIMGPNIVYVGAVMQHEMGDLGDEKGITLMLDQQLKFVKTDAPQFRRVEIYTEKDLKSYLRDRGEDYYEIVLKSDAVEYVPTSYKEKVVEDFEYTTETRLETVKGEELIDTVDRFIDQANTAIDKRIAKDFLRDLAKGVK